jgi:hypothetical protein
MTATVTNEGHPESSCQCFEPNSTPEWIDRGNIGMTDDYWEISRFRCARCRVPWLSAFIEFEGFSRSGRHYRAPAIDAQLQGITPDAALAFIEASKYKIAGGSRFCGTEHVTSGALVRRP